MAMDRRFSVYVGQTIKLRRALTGIPYGTNPATTSWSSSNASVATITAVGNGESALLVGVAAGTADITATTSGSTSHTFNVRVPAARTYLTSITADGGSGDASDASDTYHTA